MKKILILLIAYNFVLLNGQISTAYSFKNIIYAVDGFAMELYIFKSDLEDPKKISLKNISRNSIFDFFIKYDDFYSYLADSNMDVIFFLDKDLSQKKSVNIKEKYNISIYRKIFPSEYDELIISSKNKNEIFKLKNNRLTRIISLELDFDDFFADQNFIYLLSKGKISVYSHTGIYIKNISVPTEMNYTDFIVNDSRIYLKSKNIVTSVNRLNNKFSNLEINDITGFAAKDSLFYFFSGDSLKLNRISL